MSLEPETFPKIASLESARHLAWRWLWLLVGAAWIFVATAPELLGQAMQEEASHPFYDLVVADPLLFPDLGLQPIDDVQGQMDPAGRAAWSRFVTEQAARGPWNAHVDRRNGLVEIAEGAGVPWIPGAGNDLTLADIAAHLRGRSAVDLDTLESIARAFLTATAQPLVGTGGRNLVLDRGASSKVANYLWNVEFQVFEGGLQIDGARVFFRVNNGNLVQWGAEKVPGPGAQVPHARIDGDQAFDILGSYIGGWDDVDDWIHEPGHLVLVPGRLDLPGNAFGRGYDLVLVWQFGFTRDGAPGTWRARIDAVSGEVLEFRDMNQYAQVTGGYWPVSWRIGGVEQPQTLGGWPFVSVTPLGETSNSSGIYFWDGNAQMARHTGPYVDIIDNCGGGPGTAASDGSGNIAFGQITVPNAPGDCQTQLTIADNTPASRQQFFHVNKIMEKGRAYNPSNIWLQTQVTATVNINNTCNAFWNGSSLNFYRSGNGCGNTGEDAGISLHEWGHGFDSNDGSPGGTENGTGETYGDFTAALQTHNSCTGNGFLLSGANCGGYSNACTGCDGVRDIDWGKHTANVPWTVSTFTRTNCPNTCPGTSCGYVGPCGLVGGGGPTSNPSSEGHCESYVSSGALWDLAAYDLQSGCSGRNAGFPDWNCPGAGGPYNSAAAWGVADRLWYRSRSSANQSFTCSTAGSWSSNGCNAGSNWKTMRAVDDDDGNLANGTPHSCQLAAAFGRHGIACTTDPAWNVCFQGCTAPAAPTLSVTNVANNQVTLSWSPDPTPDVVDVYRNDVGCNAGFTKIADDVDFASVPFSDTAVANGTTYYYQVVREPVGNEACASPPSNCVNATPTATPSALYVSGSAALAAVTADADGDGFVDNCETGQMSFELYNDGTVTLNNLRATITSSDPAVGIATAMPVNVGTLAPAGRVTGFFEFNVDGATCKDTVSFDIAVTADEMQALAPPLTKTDSFSLADLEQDFSGVGNFTHDFETGNDGWTFVTNFARENVTADSGTWSVHSSSTLDGACDLARSPNFKPQGVGSQVVMAVRFDVEAPFWDKANVHAVRVSTGAHALLSPTGRAYTTGTWNTGLCHVSSDNGWAGTNLTWGNATFNLSGLVAGELYYLEVNYNTDAAVHGTGFWFDNVRWTSVDMQVCDGQSDLCVCNPPDLAGTPTAVDLDACTAGVQVSWTDVVDWGDSGPAGRSYEIFRSTDGVVWVSAGIDPDLASPFVDTGATPGVAYRYKVRATNTCGTLVEIDTGATTTTDAVAEPTFAGLASATDLDACMQTGVALAWPAPGNWQNACASPGDCQFRVYRGATLIATLDQSTFGFTDTGGAANTSYTYRVEAENPSCANDGGVTINAADASGATPVFAGITSAVDNGCDGITLGWTAPSDWGDGGLGSQLRWYNVLRGGQVIASIGGGATGFIDANAPLGVLSTYSVRAYNRCQLQSDGGGATQAATNADNAPAPTFAGVQTAAATAGDCSVDLGWTAATPGCGGAIVYNVYRSTTNGFAPAPANRIATGVSGTAYNDGTLSDGVTFYYKVRAEELTDGTGPGGGKEETNSVQASATTGGTGTVVAYTHDFETGTGFDDWGTGFFGGTAIQSWRGIQTCTANSGTHIFRFGGNACTSDYGNSRFQFAEPATATGISVPAGATNVQMSFYHRRQFESGGGNLYDGGTLGLSINGTNYTLIPATALSGTSYNGTLAAVCPPMGTAGFPIFGGTSASFTNTVVDLDAVCDLITAGTTGCAGLTIWPAFVAITDCSGTADGWFLDDVVVTYDQGVACTETPNAVTYQSATAQGAIGNGNVKVEWRNPGDEVYVKTKLVRKGGSAPANPGDGTQVWDSGTAGAYGSVFDTGLATNGTAFFFNSYVYPTADDSGPPSAAATASARPINAGTPAENWTWAYSTAAAAMVTPALVPGAIGSGAVYAVSNDRIVHGMNPDDVAGTGGTNGSGEWLRSGPYSWTPRSLNGISQHRPLVVPMTLQYHGTSTGLVVFLGAQDGRVYAVDGRSGAIAWTSAVLGESVQASPGGFLAAFGTAYDLLIAGTRNTASHNSLVALDLRDGTTRWTWNNGGGANGLGIVNGLTVDWAKLRLYVTTRASLLGGSADTVWALAITPGGFAPLWSRDVGNVDTEPVLANGKLYVGNTGGVVYSLDPDTGATNWSYDASVGPAPVKGFVFPEYGSNRLFVATDDLVWLADQGSSALELDRDSTIASPSTPLWWVNSNYLYVGSGDGRLYEITLDRGTPAFVSSKSVQLGDGTAAVGSPAGDVINKLIYVGAENGRIYAVPAAPMP